MGVRGCCKTAPVWRMHNKGTPLQVLACSREVQFYRYTIKFTVANQLIYHFLQLCEMGRHISQDNYRIGLFAQVKLRAIFECVVNAVRYGMNRVPFKYTISRQEGRKSVIIVSRIICCSPSLSGAIRINSWNIESVTEAMRSAITIPNNEKKPGHEKQYKYVSSHDVAYWARNQSFLGEPTPTSYRHYSYNK
ncbi:trehalose phosphatase/synthase 11 [Artemisia annua]|uniref:Trehalose phosphatase/synthase 11 n=1 Tax=Artemisia annua TaxID=35608 RepID=A0A2U1KIE9_ARTAN|nr:trehalose phosphatase/synthase 11 [Artemisia annua]